MHNPRETALVFDDQGWISLDILIEFINHQKNWNISKSDLDKLIINNKQLRYTFNHDNSKLRGNPIPCIDFDIPLNIPTAIPPAYLYYGYGQSSDIWIERHGLCLLGQLQYIVLASSADTALDLASWKYEHTFAWRIHAEAMHKAGYLFYHTDDDLWLVCESIPYEYIEFLR